MLKITEIFHSLQGESTLVGLPTVFVRLTGCPLRCGYCDSEYAFHGGERLSIAEICAKVAAQRTQYVTVTGGEPLAQPACHDLLRALCDAGYTVSLETSGALDISSVDPRVIKVMDIKTPGSGEEARNRWANIAHLTTEDQAKFVLCSRDDYSYAKKIVNQYALAERCQVLFSPVHNALDPADLADWILGDHLPVRFQMQLHKVLWGDVAGR